VLVDQKQEPGEYQILWNGRTDHLQNVPTGIYFYRLKAGSFEQIKKMTLIR